MPSSKVPEPAPTRVAMPPSRGRSRPDYRALFWHTVLNAVVVHASCRSVPRMGAFEDLAAKRNVVVTTYKRDGSTVPTTVNVVVHGDHAYFRTWSTAGKAKRLRRDPRVLIAPSTARGKPTGPAVPATARLLGPEEEQPIRQALAKKYPLLQGQLVPLVHRLRHYRTVHYELTAS